MVVARPCDHHLNNSSYLVVHVDLPLEDLHDPADVLAAVRRVGLQKLDHPVEGLWSSIDLGRDLN